MSRSNHPADDTPDDNQGTSTEADLSPSKEDYGMISSDEDEGSRRDIPFVPEPSIERLNERQRTSYAEHRERFIRWMYNLGKDPEKAKGYAHETTRRRARDTDEFYRWVWDDRDGYTTQVTHDDADAFCRELVYEDHSDTHCKNIQKSLKTLFRWREDPWEPSITFTANDPQQAPREYLTREERHRLEEASLEWGTIPGYTSVTPEERTRWKRHLAQRYRVPMDEVGPKEFQKANGFKVPSLVHTALDAGLRPIEVARAKVSWVDEANEVLRIPKEEASKGSDRNWVIALRSVTTRLLGQWLDERECYPKYDDSERIWLTRLGEPYSSRSLGYLVEQLCDVADIDTERRDVTFYALRHSTGTYISREDGLAAAASQLRHVNIQTTAKYDNSPPDERRDALENI